MTEAEQLKLFWEREALLAQIQYAQQKIQEINKTLSETRNAENKQSNTQS